MSAQLRRQVHYALIAVNVVLVLLLLYGVVLAWLTARGETTTSYVLVLAVLFPVPVLRALTQATRVRLEAGHQHLRGWTIGTGLCTLLASVPVLTGLLGILTIGVGLYVVSLGFMIKGGEGR